jgi:hypothetical protein
MSGFKYFSSSHLDIDRPERYVKQLNSHLSKKAALQEGFLLFPGLGAALATTTDNGVQLNAYADDEESLTKIQGILTKHLYKFAKVEDLDAFWS